MSNFYLYTETAYHHQGSMEYMKSLIDATIDSGARGIKFQVLTRPEDAISTRHSAFENISSYCFNFEEWNEIFNYTSSRGLEIILMPINIQALDLVERHQIKYIDIHSVSFNDRTLLKHIKISGVQLILGVGGRTIEEIVNSKLFFGDQLKVLMVGFQSFPTELIDIKLNKISVLKTLFPELKIGYADHSIHSSELAISSNEYARILGAEVFEKHIAIEEGKERLDWQAAISKEKINEIIRRLTFLDKAVLLSPHDVLTMSEAEVTYRNRQLRCVAAREIAVGEVLTENDISLKMVEDQERAFSDIAAVVGKTVSNTITYDSTIHRDDIK